MTEVDDEREEPPAPSQRTFCSLLAAVMFLVFLPVGMSTVGCGWYTLTTHDWVVVGAAWPVGIQVPVPRTLQWVGPGHHLVSAAFHGSYGRAWADSLLPVWKDDTAPSLWLSVGVQCPARDFTHVRVTRVRLIDPSVARDVPPKHQDSSSSKPDTDGWVALRRFREAYDWQAAVLVDAVQLPTQEPLELVVEYELRRSNGEVSAHRFAAPCRHTATTTTTFHPSRPH